ncbi:hypothetical protein [Conchiformibius steedae]|uniref:hypothetical protein n=1 Tax=Conchiformibius steedae TaxID=153493 RepID=UPI0026EEBABA|nr:hypothetical protein [Conchiformibius steedae]
MNKTYLLVLITLLLYLAASKLRKTAQAAWQRLISLVINLFRSAKSFISINNLKAVLSLLSTANINKSIKWIFALIVLIVLLHIGVEIVQTILAGQRISIEHLKFLMEIAGLILYF